MSFKRSSPSKPSFSRGCNKIRLLNKHEIAEIDSWVNFISKNGSDNEEQFCIPSLRRKEESKEYILWCMRKNEDKIYRHWINKHLRSNCLQNLGSYLIELCSYWKF